MNMNLFRMEFRRNAPGLAIWTAIICLLIMITMMVYPTFMANQSKVIGMLNIVPKEMLQFKGISDLDSILTVLGFYTANNLITMMVLGSIFSIVLSAGILLREEYNKTAEYLISKPLTRSEIFFTKGIIVFLNILILNILTSLAGYIGMEMVKTAPYNVNAFLILSLNTFLLNLLFGSVGIIISVLVRRARPVTSLCIGIVLVLYFIYSISKISAEFAFIGFISPFSFVAMDVYKPDYSINIWHLAYFLIIASILSLASWKLYQKKDIYV